LIPILFSYPPSRKISQGKIDLKYVLPILQTL
jgi:hypothetical protein